MKYQKQIRENVEVTAEDVLNNAGEFLRTDVIFRISLPRETTPKRRIYPSPMNSEIKSAITDLVLNIGRMNFPT